MTWRGTTTITDRVFSCLVYALPVMDMILLLLQGQGLMPQGSLLSPVFELLIIPFIPLITLYTAGGGMMSFIIFLLLFMALVRNENMPHFLRFNAMQSILIGIVLSLFGLAWRYFLDAILSNTGLLVETLGNAIFLGTLAVVIYSVVQSALGRYAEIPTISDAAYSQVR
jgi:uncharacterized membrane protein